MTPPPGIPITFFRSDKRFGEFSNFYPSDIEYDGVIYRSAEHLFTALRFIYPGAPEDNKIMVNSIVNQKGAYNVSLLYRYYKDTTRSVFVLESNNEEWQRPLIRLAKKLQKKNIVENPDFDSLGVMKMVLENKFKDNDLRDLLESTGDNELVYESSDQFWGMKKGKGENNLGKLLMEIR